MRHPFWLLILALFLLESCELKLKPFEENEDNRRIEVCRYDRLESQYLTTGDFSALQQMNTDYPMETRILLENVLRIGEANDPQINHKFLTFYQDSTLQSIISDAESQYANMDDINKLLNMAFDNLKMYIPNIPVPQIYAQIGALDQSIIIGNQTIGISLDKYLGANYPLYKRYYTSAQTKSMTRENIVPDCLSFYLLSLYPMQDFEARTQLERDLHIGKIMWVCNRVLGSNFFKSRYISVINKYMVHNKAIDLETLLNDNDYSKIIGMMNK